EPALAAVESVALQAADARVLFGSVDSREALRLLAGLGPRLVYLAEQDGSVWLREGGRVHWCPAEASEDAPRDRYAGPAAFRVGAAHRSRCSCVGTSWRRWLVTAVACAVLLPSAAALPSRPHPALSVSFVVEPAALDAPASPSPAPTDAAGSATTR